MTGRSRALDWILSIFALGVIAAIFIAALSRPRSGGLDVGCRTNLFHLWQMTGNYQVQYGGPEKRYPADTGKDFWLRLRKPPTVLIDPTLEDLYSCPFSQTRPGDTSYRGPTRDPHLLGSEDPVGADLEENHGTGNGGNVLLKSGEVKSCAWDDRPWTQAAMHTTPSVPPVPPESPPRAPESTPGYVWILCAALALVAVGILLRGLALRRKKHD